MIDKQSEIRRIWGERFSDSRQWMTEVFSRVYNDEEALALSVDGQIVSSLLLRKYALRFLSVRLKAAYVYGAATRRAEQGKGYMSELMTKAIEKSFNRGDDIVMLRPARRPLFGFYARFGFSTTFFIDEMRYTSSHRFESGEADFSIEEVVCDIDELAKAYERLTMSRESTVVHTVNEFKTILIDNAIDGGLKAIARDDKSGQIEAIAFAVARDQVIVVRELAYGSELAADAVLNALKSKAGEKMMVVIAPCHREGVKCHDRAMARIVNVKSLLEKLVAIDPTIRQVIRVRDQIIEANDAYFVIADGKVERIGCRGGNPSGRESGEADMRPDLDVSIDVLASIVFSSPKVGEIFNLPTARPFMALMLD